MGRVVEDMELDRSSQELVHPATLLLDIVVRYR